MEARKIGAAYGWMWLKQGFWLFKRNPLLWMVLTAIGVVGMFGISTIPVVGDALSTLLFPAFFAGYMIGCHELAQEEELELAHLFAGFQKHGTQLIALGGINLIGQLAILGVMIAMGGSDLVNLLMSGKQIEDPEALTQAVAAAGLSTVFVGVVLFCALLMAMQFAPMLVIFRNLAPMSAVQTSLRAFLRNALPLTMFGIMLLPFAIMASLPMMLGWLVLLPILITSMYAVYRDLFPMESDLAANRTPAPPADQPPAAS